MKQITFGDVNHIILDHARRNPSTIKNLGYPQDTYRDQLIENCFIEQETGSLTSEGRLLLQRVTLIGPQTVEQQSYVLGNLVYILTFKSHIQDSLYHYYAFLLHLIKYIEDDNAVPRIEITEKGKTWLREHMNIMLHTNRWLVVEEAKTYVALLTIEALPAFLSSDNVYLREAAKQRLDEQEVK